MRKISEFLKKTGKYTMRWLYFAALVVGFLYGFLIWNKYVLNASWSDEKKSSYIQEQSDFSFDKASYNKTIEYMKIKKESLGSQEKYSGRDLFYADGF